MTWNPRFQAYAASLGMTPEAALEHDGERFPGGRMTGFLLWIGERWQTWSNARTGTTRSHWLFIWSEEDRADFDAWLIRSFSTGAV